MERTEIASLYRAVPADGTVLTVCGWAKNIRRRSARCRRRGRRGKGMRSRCVPYVSSIQVHTILICPARRRVRLAGHRQENFAGRRIQRGKHFCPAQAEMGPSLT